MKLTEKQAKKWEADMRRLETDPSVSKRELRLFMQLFMECGHSVGELLTCNTGPWGCVQCNYEFDNNKKLCKNPTKTIYSTEIK